MVRRRPNRFQHGGRKWPGEAVEEYIDRDGKRDRSPRPAKFLLKRHQKHARSGPHASSRQQNQERNCRNDPGVMNPADFHDAPHSVGRYTSASLRGATGAATSRPLVEVLAEGAGGGDAAEHREGACAKQATGKQHAGNHLNSSLSCAASIPPDHGKHIGVICAEL